MGLIDWLNFIIYAAPSGDPHHLCLLSYNIPVGFVKIVASHGNSKQSTPFYPTLPSTKVMMTAEVLHSGPKRTVSVVSSNLGGVIGASSSGELPRNERQATYMKHRSGKSHPDSSCDPRVDQVFAIMQQAKLGDVGGKFVRDTRPAPDPAFVLARDRQLDNMVRFCAGATDFSIFTVDPTFSLGDFDVTPITYHHLLLETVRYGTHPVFVGPTLVHYRKTFGTYLFFASSLIGLRPDLRAVHAFGTDGEKALADAFGHEFRYATHLSCFIHFRRNLKQELRDRKFSAAATKSVLDDIFGVQHGDVFAEGLVDSSSEEDFDKKLESLKKKWESLEMDDPMITSGFHGWFQTFKAETVRTTMLKSVREEAGLGCPPDQFTTNSSEAVNSVIKKHMNFKSHQLVDFVQHMKEVVDEQDREVERAVIGRGKYRFRQKYRYLQIAESSWFKMSEKQREGHMKKVSATKVLPQSEHSADEGSSATQSTSSLGRPVSVDVNVVAAKVSVHLDCLKGIWKKAEELLQSPTSMSPAPGQPESARMVISRGGKRPHLVVPSKGGRFKCDSDCINFKSLGICSHSIAVAELNGTLPQFLAHFEKGNKKPNFTALALHDMPAGRGRKGCVPPRKKKRSQSAEQRVDHLEGLTTSAPSLHALSGTVSALSQAHGNSTVNCTISLDSGSGPPVTTSGSIAGPSCDPLLPDPVYSDWGQQFYPYFSPYGSHSSHISAPPFTPRSAPPFTPRSAR